MKFRIFYAPQVFRTWEKVFVLTSDGKLYCQYLFKFSKQEIIKNDINYNNFAPKDYSWGKGVEGDRGIAVTNFQECEKELSWNEYTNLRASSLLSGYSQNNISQQIRWVNNYLSSIGLTPNDWDEESYNKFKND